MSDSRIYIIMGVSGCGKSTIGKLLADALQLPYFDGDDFHPEENVAKMSKGKALTDEDRLGWLQSLNQLSKHNSEKGAVIACSALKKSYREVLLQDMVETMVFVYLKGSFDEISRRMRERKDHFMPVGLLKSQFKTLEPPRNAITVSITDPPAAIVTKILEQIQ